MILKVVQLKKIMARVTGCRVRTSLNTHGLSVSNTIK